jgi:hypothetical protein
MISYLNKSGLKLKEKLFEKIVLRNGELEEIFNTINSGINFKEFEEDLLKDVSLPSRLEQCDKNDFESLKKYLEYKTKKIFFLKEIIDEEYLFYKNYVSKEKVKLEGKINEVKNKIAFLGGFQGDVISAFVEDFNNMMQVDGRLERSLSVDTRNSACTLMVVKEAKTPIRDILILSSSNGIAGNILEGTNSYLSNSLNNNENLYFEYYKPGKNALDLNLEITLNNESIINFSEISIKQKYLESNIKIEEVVFIDSDGAGISIFSLIDSSMQDLEIESYNSDNKIVINHLPVKAKRIKVFLKCTEPTLIDSKYYTVIALKEIGLYAKSYNEEGELNFKEFELDKIRGSLLSNKIISYPKNKPLCNFEAKAIFDEETEVILNDEKLIIEEDFKSVRYTFKMKKPESLSNLYVDNESYKEVNLNVKQQRFNRDVVPNTITIPYDSEFIEVYQPDIYQRSFELRKAKKVGVTNETVTKILLPENLEEVGLSLNSMQVYVDDMLCERRRTDILVGEGLSYYSDGEYLFVRDQSTTKGKTIMVAFPPEEGNVFEEKGNIYFELNHFIDRDKEKIEVHSFSNELQSKEETHIDYVERIKLDESYVCNVIVFNQHEENITDSYNIDFKLGLLSIKEEAERRPEVTVQYDYFKYLKTKPERFWKVENEIKGFVIDKSNLHISSFTQLGGEDFDSYRHYREVTSIDVETRRRVIAEKTLYLKSKNILRKSVSLDVDFFGEEKKPLEVEYINGVDEFSNLSLIEKEAAPLLEANSLGEVSFTLRYKPAEGRAIKIYKSNRLLSFNEYSFSLEGRIITIRTSEETSKGLSVSYFGEVIKESDSFYSKYSIDYIHGILYSEDLRDPNKGLSFNSLLSVVDSSVCKQIYSWSTDDGSIFLNPAETSKTNSLIKVSWRKKESIDFSDMHEFFSPIIYRLKYELRG